MQDFLKELWSKYNHGITLAYFLFFGMAFKYLEANVVPQYYMYSPIDDHIPFLKSFIIPYLFWYIYIGATMVYFFFKSKNDFLRLSAFLYVGMTISLIVYFILPNGQNLRPLLSGNDILTQIIGWIYTVDTPTNSAPSMHVINSLATHFAICNYNKFKRPELTKGISLILTVLICLSTMFIKQHSVIDVAWGIVVSLVLYVFIYKNNWKALSLNFTEKLDYNEI